MIQLLADLYKCYTRSAEYRHLNPVTVHFPLLILNTRALNLELYYPHGSEKDRKPIHILGRLLSLLQEAFLLEALGFLWGWGTGKAEKHLH